MFPRTRFPFAKKDVPMQHATIVTFAFLALAAPAFGINQQHPSAAAATHPATGAHANAVAGQANAALLEGCARQAGALIDNLDKGDFKTAAVDFDGAMQAELDGTKLAAIWKQVGATAGKLEGRGATQNVMYDGHAIVSLPLRFQKMLLNARVSCDADGKIAGFFLQPAASGNRN